MINIKGPIILKRVTFHDFTGGHFVFGSGKKWHHIPGVLRPMQIPPMTPPHGGHNRNFIVDHATPQICDLLAMGAQTSIA